MGENHFVFATDDISKVYVSFTHLIKIQDNVINSYYQIIVLHKNKDVDLCLSAYNIM